MRELWGLIHALRDSEFETLEDFVDRERPYEADYSLKLVFNPVDYMNTPVTDREAIKREIKLHIVELEVHKEVLGWSVESVKKEIRVLDNYYDSIQEQERAEVEAELDAEFLAEMEKKEAERRKNIAKSELNQWRKTKLERSYSGGKLLKDGERPHRLNEKDVATGELYETLDWVAFIDILPIPKSYNANATNRFEVNYGVIPSLENFLNHKRDGHNPTYDKTSKRFKTEEETNEFYTKTKERLEKELKRKEGGVNE